MTPEPGTIQHAFQDLRDAWASLTLSLRHALMGWVPVMTPQEAEDVWAKVRADQNPVPSLNVLDRSLSEDQTVVDCIRRYGDPRAWDE